MPNSDRDKAVSVMADAIEDECQECGATVDAVIAQRATLRALTALQAEGMAVVPRDRMVYFFAEIDAAIVSVQGALRHYQQPQDVHFHLALKACRDGTAILAASPSGKPEVKEKDDE